LIAPLRKLGIKAARIDSSGKITELGRFRSNQIFSGYFGEKIADDIIAKYGTFDLMT
jgi:hypothetical protein